MGNIKDVYLSGEIDDYVVFISYPNLYIVMKSGKEVKVPIYSERMYDYFETYEASKEIYKKVDSLYAQFISDLKNNKLSKNVAMENKS